MKKSIAILGMGRFGQFLADELCANGADVLIADNEERVVNQYAGIVSEAVIVDLLDPVDKSVELFLACNRNGKSYLSVAVLYSSRCRVINRYFGFRYS